MPAESITWFDVVEIYDQARVEIRSSVDPISLQASAGRKAEFRRELGAAVQQASRGIFTHDVEVTLTWYISESRRYQTHLVADLDNVMKPILDAVTGPDGILIDDNQIQSVKACWMTPGARGTGFDLTFEALMRDDFIEREGLTFVEFSANRCYPLPGLSVPGHEASFVNSWRIALARYQSLLEAGVDHGSAQSVLPLVRPFPRARLGRFMVRHESEFSEDGP
ncbi:RusA family crossover junction endodeoxyribonuclease [Aeromicrobium tamlense]|uniref:RusA family crossover junction endodeoxyribonuclease n=1 Tax=Aeromicrobium tamlense TaxID=375541 RepID=A0A8I0KLE8_9ACTN|nr:RusA family crossover junction endodeoxyribonuclease [Aeromicrobium tamlense]MBD1269993.1 RusA family crossover junction endodeoxyribonuclease [Aeromicrobium tamlense]NYI39349.1 hypothetical protein [Aeromicrobium tamlense]